MIAEVIYTGELRTKAMHLKSGNEIITDAPVDNHGKGEAFSPTDLTAVSLATCMITVMGISAEKQGIQIKGTTAQVTKIMDSDPRRISEIKITLTFPKGVNYADNEKEILINKALTCPVALSLHPDIVQDVQFIF